MYFNEDVVLDLRLNVLDKYVDYFVIVESVITHKGEKRELKFNNKKFQKFKDKIIYIVYDKIEEDLEIINADDREETKTNKYIMNALRRENSQRDYIEKGISGADENDIILISDVDEMPNLSGIDFTKIKEKIFMFRQDMFYYKFNLKLPNMIWTGTKGCRKKYLLSPQWLRNVKDRKYSKLRFDILFSDKKYNSIKFIDDGGWHFTNLKSAKEIEHKLKSYLHHWEFDENPLTTDQIEDIIKNKQAIYDLTLDKRLNKIGSGNKLIKYEFEKLPEYLKKNKNKYEKWLD
jgi:beta-1,4-mannosyl-glycoprotein beta-1,4-N-acetylglucosaminyltransferase